MLVLVADAVAADTVLPAAVLFRVVVVAHPDTAPPSVPLLFGLF